jgi:hypothetical protein
MKLSECTFGAVVINDNLEVGHVVGFTYNIAVCNTGHLSNEELLSRTIPVVKFPKGETPIHHSNLKLFKG